MGQTYINPAGQPIGRAGQIADTNWSDDPLSGFNNDTTSIGFGQGVKRDVADNSGRGFKNLASLTDLPSGVSVFSYRHQNGTTGDLDSSGNQIAGAAVDVLNRGRIYVLTEGTVAPEDRAYVRAVATGGLNVGNWANGTVQSASYFIDVTRLAKFLTGGSTGPVVLEVDFTNRNT